MAATYRTSAAGGGTSGTTDRTVAITPAVGDLLICFASLSGNTQTTPTMTDNNSDGIGWTLVNVARWSTSANIMACFVRNGLMSNTTSTTITCVSGSNTAGELVVVAYSGMTRVGLNAIRGYGAQENQASGGSPTPALPQACLTGNPTIWAVASGDTTTSPNASWTERRDVSQSTPTTCLEVATRDSGFTGTSVAAAATQSTVFASMIIELNSSTSTFGLGASAQANREITGVAGTLTTSAVTTQASGSAFVIGRALGNTSDASPSTPNDNKSNTYTVLGADTPYSGFPTSSAGVWKAGNGAGGSGHTFSEPYGRFSPPSATGDECTVSGVEITGSSVDLDASATIVERAAASTITSNSVTTAGPAVLIAHVWGNGGGTSHIFLPSPTSGFMRVPTASVEQLLPSGNEIQVQVLYRYVPAAGTYSLTVDGSGEGAIMMLNAFKEGGGSNFTASPSETWSTWSESLGVSQPFAATPSETVTISGETVGVVYGAKPAPAETVSLSESLAQLFAATVGLPETVALSESLLVSQAYPLALSETVTISSESVTATLGAIAALSETVSMAEAIALLAAAVVNLPESVSVAEAVAGGQAFIAGPTETVSVSELVAARLGAIIGLADTALTLSDAIGVLLAAIVGLPEAVSVAEAVAGGQAFTAPLSETVTISSETALAAYSAIAALLETVGVSESAAVSQGIPIAAAETVTLAEAVALLYAAIVAAPETVSLTEARTIVAQAIVGLPETVGLSEALPMGNNFVASPSETWSTWSDAASSSFAALAALAETVPLAEQLGLVANLLLAIAESLGAVSEQVAANPARIVGLPETVPLADALGSLAAYLVAIGETAPTSELLAASRALASSVGESMSVLEVLNAVVPFVVSFGDTAAITELLSAIGGSTGALVAVLVDRRQPALKIGPARGAAVVVRNIATAKVEPE